MFYNKESYKPKKLELMKTQIRTIYFLISFAALVLTASCRTEDDVFIDTPSETTLLPNSVVASRMQGMAMNDGSQDNIVYNANCFTIQLPVSITVNGVEITINSISDYDTLEDILDEFDDDDDTIDIMFPITIVLADYTEIEVNSLEELDNLSDDCNGENEFDDDIECLDFVYPITASVFNTNNEVISTITLTNDNELFEFIDDIEDDDVVGFEFPISLVLSDGSELVVNNFDELEDVIDTYEDDCDEDDDYDYNDDDCDSCTPDQLISVLIACSDWYIDDLERNDEDLEDNFSGYLFNFFQDNTLTVSWDDTTETGTWSASGSGNNITVIINISGFDDVNDTWNLHEIDVNDDDDDDDDDDNETEVSFKIGDDELEFKNDTCN